MDTRRLAADLLLGAVIALVAPAGAAAAHKERVLNWSGYRWTVRHAAKPGPPLHNLWGDSKANVRVLPNGRLRVNIVRGRSVEVVGPRTGYGRYTWVVETDMSTADPFRVAAFFVRGTRGEQDIEFSRWGEPLMQAPGTWVSWLGQVKRVGWASFAVTPDPPYTIRIDWRPKRSRFSVADRIGTVLVDRTIKSIPAGRHVAPRISYWLYPGHGQLLSPYTPQTVHPPVIIRSFRYERRSSG